MWYMYIGRFYVRRQILVLRSDRFCKFFKDFKYFFKVASSNYITFVNFIDISIRFL